jgi:hypothetical protein
MNWGYKLLFAFSAFGIMIFYLVYRSYNTQFDLVEKDYYKTELRYQKVIDGTNRTNTLSSDITLGQDGKNITLQLPYEIKDKPVSGTVWFYCAYNAGNDRTFQMKVDDSGIQKFSIKPGNYTVKIDWECKGIAYYTEKALHVL